MIGWHQAPEVAWDRKQRLTQYTPDIDWGSPVRPRVTHRIRRALAVLVAGAALTVAGTAAAHADGTSFLDTLTDSGVQVYDASQAIDTGWAICEAFEVANGRDVAEFLYANSSYADVPDMATAELWVIAAAYNLCPEHIHTDQTARTLA